MRRSAAAAVLGLMVPLVLVSGLVFAAPQEITITPTSASPVINAGATYTNSFQVINNGQTGYDYKIYSLPYHVIGENYTPSFTEQPNVTNAARWFEFSATTGHNNPAQSHSITYRIHVPPNTPSGGYYATVFAETSNTQTGGVALNERVGEIFYIQVAGPVIQAGKLLSWHAAFLQSTPVVGTVRLQNSGNLHYLSTTNIVVKDVFGRQKFSFSTSREVLPQTTRELTATWSNPPPLGLFKVSGDVTYLDHHTALGTKWVLVIAVPLRIVFVFLILAIIALVARSSVKRHLKPRQKRT